MARGSLQLQDGTQVDFFDSDGSASLEQEWADAIKGSKQPAVLRTSGGRFQCWIASELMGVESETAEQAAAEMQRLLAEAELRSNIRPCTGVGTYVSDAVIGMVGEHRVTICHDCEEYVAVEGNLIAFHPM